MTDAEYTAALEAALADDESIVELKAAVREDLLPALAALHAATPDASSEQLAELLWDRFPEVWEKNRKTIRQFFLAKTAQKHMTSLDLGGGTP